MNIRENLFSLDGKIAVITGGAGVLGSAIAEGLGKAGATILICDFKNAEQTVQKLQSKKIKAAGYFINVLEIEKIKECARLINQDYKQIDILVNAAGGNLKDATTAPDLSFFDLPLSSLEKVINLNLFGGAILPAQVFGKSMINNKIGGSIINISSMNAFRPLTRIPGYSAAKSAVSNFTQWLAVHLAQEYNKKIRVNAIAPGFFLTEQNRYLMLDEKGNFTARAQLIIQHTPMGKFGNPEDVIGTCIWLASSASEFVTGTVIPIDGGFNAYAGV